MIPKIPTKKKIKKEAKPEIRLPYPQRMKKKDLNEIFLDKFLKILKKLEINIPLFKALEQMFEGVKKLRGF